MWLAIAVGCVGCFALKLVGYSLPRRVIEQPVVKHVADLLPVAPHLEYRIPPFDLEALLTEVELLLDWYLPRLNEQVSDKLRQEFRAVWAEALAPVLEAPPTWVLPP